MPELSSSPSNSSIADRKTSDQIPPEQPSPIRALYKTEDELRELALASENVQRALDGRGIRTVIVRAPKLVNIVPA